MCFDHWVTQILQQFSFIHVTSVSSKYAMAFSFSLIFVYKSQNKATVFSKFCKDITGVLPYLSVQEINTDYSRADVSDTDSIIFIAYTKSIQNVWFTVEIDGKPKLRIIYYTVSKYIQSNSLPLTSRCPFEGCIMWPNFCLGTKRTLYHWLLWV